MPSQATLKLYRGKPDSEPVFPIGAFWLRSKERIFTLEELRDEAASLRYEVVSFSKIPEDRERQLRELEMKTMHLGNMICMYSDSKIENFDERLKHAQRQAIEYHLAVIKEPFGSEKVLKLYNRAVDENLALGYEVRSRLRETIAKIVPFGKTIDVDIEANPEMSRLIKEASLYYPSSWNDALAMKISAKFVKNAGASWFSPDENSIQITNGQENFVSYPTMADARIAAGMYPRQYETQVERVHELAHKFESINDDVVAVSKSFLRRRALPTQAYDFAHKDQIVEDHFSSPYVGTIYGYDSLGNDRHFEVLSMGMESTFTGTNGSLIGLAHPAAENNPIIKRYRPDTEHRNLTVGFLTGTMMSINNERTGKPVNSIFGIDDSDDFKLWKRT